MTLRSTLVCLGLAAATLSSAAWAGSRADEQKRVTSQIQAANYSQRIDGLRDVCFSGITSTAFFDGLDAKFKTQWAQAETSGDKQDVQEAIWMAKALACSGNAKYLPTLQGVTEGSRHMRGAYRHVSEAIEELPKYERWNAIVYNEAGHPAGQGWEVTTALNMLRSSESELSLMGVRQIARLAQNQPALYNEVEKMLLARYTQGEGDDKHYDNALSWYCKVLGDSGNEKFKATLEKVESDAANAKVRKHAAKALSRL